MPKLIILGSANSIPTLQHNNTHMVVVGEERVLLIDTATNPILRLEQAGVDVMRLTDVILTHFHPDHVSGLPMLLMDSWLLGRKQPLNIYGLEDIIDRAEIMMGLFGWDEWPAFFPVRFVRLAAEEKAPVFQSAEFSVAASPVEHMVPNIGLRVDFHASQQSFAYSSDTTPTPCTARLAQGADVLIHEATGEGFGHTSAAQAGEIASQAGVKKLVLIHYDPFEQDHQHLIAEAKTTFSGEVELADDFMQFNF
jgi:ribonuclease Z